MKAPARRWQCPSWKPPPPRCRRWRLSLRRECRTGNPMKARRREQPALGPRLPDHPAGRAARCRWAGGCARMVPGGRAAAGGDSGRRRPADALGLPAVHRCLPAIPAVAVGGHPGSTAGSADPRPAPRRVHGLLRRAAGGLQPGAAAGDSARSPRRRFRRGWRGQPAAHQGGRADGPAARGPRVGIAGRSLPIPLGDAAGAGTVSLRQARGHRRSLPAEGAGDGSCWPGCAWPWLLP